MPSRFENTQEASHNLFDGEFVQDTWQAQPGHSKTVEQAKSKEDGTSSRARGKRGGQTGMSNKETYNFKLPPTSVSSARRGYDYKPEGRDVLRVGEMERDYGKSGRKFMTPAEQKDAPYTHKKVLGNTNTSHGAKGSLVHDDEAPHQPPGSPIGKNTHIASPRGNIGRAMQPGLDSVEYTHNQRRRAADMGGPMASKAGPSHIRPWDHGHVEPQPKTSGKQTNAGAYQKHSFEATPKQPNHPGYKLQAPFDLHH